MSARKWREASRRQLGIYLSPPGRGGQTLAYFQRIYEVTEESRGEWRTRIVNGPCVYEHEHGDLFRFFRIAREVLPELDHRAEEVERAEAGKGVR